MSHTQHRHSIPADQEFELATQEPFRVYHRSGQDPRSPRYVRRWMYMGTVTATDKDLFKDSGSRLYWPTCPRCRGTGFAAIQVDRVPGPACRDCKGMGEL